MASSRPVRAARYCFGWFLMICFLNHFLAYSVRFQSSRVAKAIHIKLSSCIAPNTSIKYLALYHNRWETDLFTICN